MHGVLNDVYYLPLPTNTAVVPTQDPNAQFAKFYLANLVFCQLLKRYAKCKKKFISNSLT
jgi:hypothetical protein